MTRDFQAGSSFGEYILDSYVGGGSFGAVWRGHHASAGQQVAVKILTGALSSSETAAMRADVELLAASAASRSQHVVHVLGGGVEPVPHIVMEYVEGTDLQGLLREKGKLSSGETIGVGLAISDALGALNDAGIIHRDIKPANVMIDKEGVIKLADFGIAKIVGYDTMTMTGQAAMTMAYAAPEIWDDGSSFGRPSHRSDLYAMGVLLYQCMTGDTPFRGNYGSLYRQHMENPPDINVLPAETPPSLRTLVRRCLEKKQQDRPADAVECVTILERAQAELDGGVANEPRQFGPWIKGEPHQNQPWAWHAHHESSGAEATVEVHFADSLDYSATLRKALATNSKLTAFGAERLIETNRLLLHPNESWSNAPAGRFQFWVARDERPGGQPGPMTLPQACAAVLALSSLIDAAAAEGLPLVMREHLELQSDGSVMLRRPGLVTPAQDDAAESALAFLRAQPAEPAASGLLASAADLKALAGLAGAADDTSTVIMNSTVLVSEGTVIVPSAHASPEAPLEPVAPAARIAEATPAPTPAFAAGAGAVQLTLNRTTSAAASSWYELTLRNQGARPLDLRLDAFDKSDVLSYSLPRQVMLAAGGNEKVRVHVEVQKRRKMGGKRITHFTVSASGSGGSNEPPVTIEGEFSDEPSSVPLFAGGVFGIAALAVAGALVFAGGSGDDSGGSSAKGFTSTTETPVATATLMPMPPPPTPIPPTPVPPTPVPPPPPEPTPEPNRANCNTIRASGTYLSNAERVWFQTNCITSGGTSSATGNTGGTTSGTTGATGGATGGTSGNTSPPPPTRVNVPAQKTSNLVGLTITGGHGSTHRLGSQLTLCYTSRANQLISVFDTTKPGSPFRRGVDDGYGECFSIVLDEVGVDSVRINAYNAAGTAVLDYAQLSIVVVQ